MDFIPLRGHIYTVYFGKQYHSELGKARPALVMQNDEVNQSLSHQSFQSVTVLPLTSMLEGGDMRVFIPARGIMLKNSEICIDQMCTVDIQRFPYQEVLTFLSEDEMAEVELKLKKFLGLHE